MRKLKALYINEMGKTVRKISVLVVVCIMFGLIGGCAIMNKQIGRFSESFVWNPDYSELYKSYSESYRNVKSELDSTRSKLEQLGGLDGYEQDDFNAVALDYRYLLIEAASNELLMNLYKIASDFSIGRQDYRSSLIEQTAGSIYSGFDLYYQTDAVFPAGSSGRQNMDSVIQFEQKIEKTKSEQLGKIEQLKPLLEAVTFRSIFERMRAQNTGAEAGQNAALYKEAYDLVEPYADSVDMRFASEVLSAIDRYVMLSSQLKEGGVDAAGSAVSAFTRERIERERAILDYSLRHNLVSKDAERKAQTMDPRSVMNQLAGIGTFLAAALVIMLAGSSISSEMNNGSIKSLIIAPVRRGKIFAAKGFSLLTMTFALLLFNYVLSVLFSGALFGFRYFGSIVFYAFGGVHSVPFLLAALASVLIDGIAVVLFASVALALSSLTHNTAVSVTLPMLGFFFGFIIDLVVGLFNMKVYLLAMLPVRNLSNLHFVDGLPSLFGIFGSGMDAIGMRAYIPHLFSWVYVSLLLVCVVWIAYDSFCRRDIT